MPELLLAYESTHGHTGEIADRPAAAIHPAGTEIEHLGRERGSVPAAGAGA